MYASLGLKIQVTELDVSMFNFEDRRKDLSDPTSEMLYLHEEMYNNIFKIFREYRDVVNSVTFWGISDKYTWKDGFPVVGRKDWPMIFDVNGNPKASFEKIINF
jgi:endo-1,4-beta-xylanase